MIIANSIAEVRAAVHSARAAGESIGFVPTMGALHAGHLSLVDASRARCDRTVVSVFVNPTQFGPGEDLDRYPRTFRADCEQLAERGCWLVFAPSNEEIYPPGYETFVEVGSVAEPWEGACRPGHYRGVATVVLKLLLMVGADQAFFGQKDYQQSLVVRQLVADFNVPTEIVICPTVREADGLAMSSRNAFLNPTQRHQARALWKSLQLAEELCQTGERRTPILAGRIRECLAEAGITEVDYIALVKAGTVIAIDEVVGPTVVALAVRVGQTRLIDNHQIG